MRQTHGFCRLEIYYWLAPNYRQQNNLVQISICLEFYLHGRSACPCRRASANFW